MESLREALNGRTADDVYTFVQHDGAVMWFPKETKDSYAIMGAQSYFSRNRREPREDQEEYQPGTAETHLIRLTTVDHPLDNAMSRQHRELFALARATGHTPENLRRYLEGEDSVIQDDPPPEKCPEIRRCATGCAALQLDGDHDRPVTQDGTHRSCQYWQFLASHGQLPTDAREAAATQAIRKISDRQAPKARTAKRASAAQTPSETEAAPRQQEKEASGERPAAAMQPAML